MPTVSKKGTAVNSVEPGGTLVNIGSHQGLHCLVFVKTVLDKGMIFSKSK